MLIVIGRTHTTIRTPHGCLPPDIVTIIGDQRQAQDIAVAEWVAGELADQVWRDGRTPADLTRIERDRERT